ncbi:hypothetical protein EDC96DRAFT_541617 [Choanephora cucurbitarum]|nr:hypothetical protein EDC96DRAFT_541617 [Choanephora cucurbitarum]
MRFRQNVLFQLIQHKKVKSKRILIYSKKTEEQNVITFKIHVIAKWKIEKWYSSRRPDGEVDSGIPFQTMSYLHNNFRSTLKLMYILVSFHKIPFDRIENEPSADNSSCLLHLEKHSLLGNWLSGGVQCLSFEFLRRRNLNLFCVQSISGNAISIQKISSIIFCSSFAPLVNVYQLLKHETGGLFLVYYVKSSDDMCVAYVDFHMLKIGLCFLF